VLALWTGIPVYKLTERRPPSVRMEDELHKRIVGQSPRSRRCRSIRHRAASDPKRPFSVHLPRPLGRQGTETAKTLAGFLFSDEAR
jgi:ATP-dependent Clp protease ATP-binding subunit ClpA